MKQLITFSAFAAIAAAGSVSAQTPAYSKPSGYVTEVLKGDGAFNLIGLTLHESPIANGSVTSVTSTRLRDSSVNFDTLLTAGSTYILQFKTGAQAGGVQVITSWGVSSGGGNTANDVVSEDNLVTGGVVAGDTYEIRKAATLSSVFGATNQAGLKSGDSTTADVIWLPTSGGGFSKFYYSAGGGFPPTTAGWKDIGGANANNQPLIFTDGFFIQRRGAGDLSLVLTGQVQTVATQVFAAASQFNYVSGIFPVGATLGTSGLQTTLKSGDITTADVLWMQNSARTGYDKFFYSAGGGFPPTTAGWKNSVGADASNQPLTSGMIIQRRGLTNVAPNVTPPSSYSNL